MIFKEPRRRFIVDCNSIFGIFCIFLNFVTFTASYPQQNDPEVVRVNKCCEKFEVFIDNQCAFNNETGMSHISKENRIIKIRE